MRDLIVTENMTLDGVVETTADWFDPAGADPDMDLSDLVEAIRVQREAADAFLVGRQTFEDMRSYWPHQADDTTGISDYLNAVHKYVVSSTLQEPGWEPTTVLRGPLEDEIRALKEAPGKDIVDHGQHHAGARADRRRARRRVPPVRLPGGPRRGPPPLRRGGGARPPAARGGPAVPVGDRAAALPGRVTRAARSSSHTPAMASYSVNERAVEHARRLIDARQYVLDSDWGDAQPRAAAENAYLESHSWEEYAGWFLGLTEGAADETKARHAFVYGDFRRVHRTGLIACVYRAAEWRHKAIELAAHDLLQHLDATSA